MLGDNLSIIRLAAFNGKLRSDPIWVEVEEAILLIVWRRWKPEYHAVRRHLNKAADALATRGVFRALEQFFEGDGQDEVEVWCDDAAFRQRGWTKPVAIPGRPGARLTLSDRPCVEAMPDPPKR